LIGAWVKKKALTCSPPEVKRTASLQRRGLFDFVSPFTVFVAVLAYFLFATFAIYVRQHPFPGFSGYRILRFVTWTDLRIVTLVYALNAFLVYWLLYRRKRWPLETRAYRMQAVGVQVKLLFYVSIVVIVFLSLIAALAALHLRRWVPFAGSAYFVIVTFFTSMMLFSLRRQAEADRFGSGPAS
jgi:hypothetical protein